jgi:predicted MFS family arabinose efflux permease
LICGADEKDLIPLPASRDEHHTGIGSTRWKASSDTTGDLMSQTSAPPAPVTGKPSARHHHAGFWLVATAFTFLTAFGTTPTPLWPLYAVRSHLDTTEITTAFAVLVVGSAGSLYFLGHLSDRFGRRRIVVPALVAAIAGDSIMAAWPNLTGLIVGRILTGVAVGLVASTATTYLTDLYEVARPGRTSARTAATVATLANLGGFAAGPLISGALAQWGPGDKLVTPYIVVGALMAVGLLLVLLTPETVDRQVAARSGAPKFRLVFGGQTLFTAAALVAFCSFAVFGIFLSLGSLIVHEELHVSSIFEWGAATAVTLGASAAAQLFLAGLRPAGLLAAGMGALPVGLAVVVVAMYHPSLALYIVGAMVAGAGAGLLFKSGLTAAMLTAADGARAGVLALFFVVAYLGMGLPPVLLAVAENYWSPRVTMIVFGSLIVTASAVATVVARRELSKRRVRL